MSEQIKSIEIRQLVAQIEGLQREKSQLIEQLSTRHSAADGLRQQLSAMADEAERVGSERDALRAELDGIKVQQSTHITEQDVPIIGGNFTSDFNAFYQDSMGTDMPPAHKVDCYTSWIAGRRSAAPKRGVAE